MDKFDQLIIEQLQQDVRRPIARIAQAVNLSRSAVSERIRRLEQQGVITGYQLLLGSQAPQAVVAAYFEVQHKSARCADLIPWLAQYSEIKRCNGISGDVDLMIYVEAASMPRLHQIREELDAHPDIVRVRTHMVLSHWIG